MKVKFFQVIRFPEDSVGKEELSTLKRSVQLFKMSLVLFTNLDSD